MALGRMSKNVERGTLDLDSKEENLNSMLHHFTRSCLRGGSLPLDSYTDPRTFFPLVKRGEKK
jgi:hypothetical protein